MNAPIVDVKQILVDNLISSSIIFLSSEPDKPDTVITLYDTGGEPPNPKWLLDFPSIQIRSRAKSYATAYANIINARDILLGKDKLTVNSTKYIGFVASGDIMMMPRDDEDRNILVVNFNITREPETGDNREAPI